MKNIQIIDGAWNATFSIFQATDEEFAELFPGVDQDMDVIEDVFDRLGDDRAKALLTPLWSRPVLKRDANGIHGTLFYDRDQRGWVLPASKREVDLEPDSINAAQRALFDGQRSEWSAPKPNEADDLLIWLTQWYFSQCNEDWEHAYGCCQSNDNLSPLAAGRAGDTEAIRRASSTQPGRLSVGPCMSLC